MLGEFPVVMDLVGSVEAAKEAKQQVLYLYLCLLFICIYICICTCICICVYIFICIIQTVFVSNSNNLISASIDSSRNSIMSIAVLVSIIINVSQYDDGISGGSDH